MHKKAFVLSIVLWIVAALLFGIATLGSLSKDTRFLTEAVNDKLKTQITAEDILEYIKFYILTADYDNNSFKNDSLGNGFYKFPKKIVVDNRWYSINKDIKIRIYDTSAMLNVMKTSYATIANVLTDSSQRQLRFVISDSIKDWRDDDDVVSLNGAENSRYEMKQGVGFKIRNGNDIQSVDELRLINGIDTISEKKWLLFKNMFYYGRANIVNLTLINSKYLSNLLKINRSEADSLISLRSKNLAKYITLVNQYKNYDDDYMGFYLSKQLKIEIEVAKGSAKSVIKCLIDFKPTEQKLYTVKSFKTF